MGSTLYPALLSIRQLIIGIKTGFTSLCINYHIQATFKSPATNGNQGGGYVGVILVCIGFLRLGGLMLGM